MEEIDVNSSTPLCLSARAEVGNSAVFGVIAGTVEKPQVAYLKQVQPLEVIKKIIEMAAAYSIDLRKKILTAWQNKEGSQRELAKRFKVSLSFIRNFRRSLSRDRGDSPPSPS
jgi:hypothetical protein